MISLSLQTDARTGRSVGRSVPSHSERTRRQGSSQAIRNTPIDKPLRMHPRTYASRPSRSDRTRFAFINFNCRCRARTRNLSPIWVRMDVDKKHHHENSHDSTGCSSIRKNKSMEIYSVETWIMINKLLGNVNLRHYCHKKVARFESEHFINICSEFRAFNIICALCICILRLAVENYHIQRTNYLIVIINDWVFSFKIEVWQRDVNLLECSCMTLRAHISSRYRNFIKVVDKSRNSASGPPSGWINSNENWLGECWKTYEKEEEDGHDAGQRSLKQRKRD
jgi:hypothetical protein